MSSKLALIDDALSYYDHTRFFIENLGQGVYPLWDPFWFNGAPNDFFLRRIGAFNPFYLLILLFKTVGIPYTLSYLSFLACYYFSGMVAFYLLAMRLYQDRLIAYGGYLILMFSALGTRLFDSYMMLVTVPLIWFFYFSVAFFMTPRRHLFIGMALSFMILAGTYIPFYFLIILGVVAAAFLLIYANAIPCLWDRYRQFARENKVLVVVSLLVVFFSFLPIISFFHDTGKGHVVLPTRHGNASASNALIVPHQTLDWGVIEDFMYSAFFSNLRLFKFAVVYVPFFSVIVFGLGLMGRITKRLVLIALSGAVLLCCIIPYGFPFYDFFYKHLFLLKFFRNLHFFIWFFLIPLFVLLVLEHWHMFQEIKLKDRFSPRVLVVYVFALHAAALAFVIWRHDGIMGTYLMILLSMVFWTLLVLERLKANAWGFFLLAVTILVQPMQAYHYFSLKALPKKGPYQYEFSYLVHDPQSIKPSYVLGPNESLYYASGAYGAIYQNINYQVLLDYLKNKFLLVDRVRPVDQRQMDPAVLEHLFVTKANLALVFNDGKLDFKERGNDPNPSPSAQPLAGDSNGFKFLSFDANHVCVSLDIPYAKFLVYNDSYDPYWAVKVDHRAACLYEANGAFKGVWVPAGRHLIEFTYGRWWQYAMNSLLSLFALIMLIGIIYYARLS